MDLDFINRRYWANGAIRNESWMPIIAGTPTIEVDGLKADTGDQMVPQDLNWFNNSEGTIVAEFYDSGHANDGGRVVFNLFQGGGATQQRFEIVTEYAPTISDRVLKIIVLNYGGQSIGGSSFGPVNDWYRVVVNWRFGTEATMQIGGFHVSLGTWAGSWAAMMERSGLAFWYNSSGSNYLNSANTGRLRRITVFKNRQSDAWGLAKSLETTKSNLHYLGDSFVQVGSELQTGNVLRRTINDTFRGTSFDGIPGTNLTQQADRFDLTPQYWGRQVVIINGSADLFSAAALNTAYDRIAAHCTLRPPIYVQPNIGSGTDNYTGQPVRVTWDAVEAGVLSHVGSDYYIPLLAGMQAAGNGSPEDNADIANGIWPRSLTGDGLHPNATGAAAMAGIIRDFLYARGW
jgi:hypothetical protein